MYRPTKLDDKIVLLRACAGLLFAVIAYIIYRSGFTLPYMDQGSTIWFLAGTVYVVTAVIIWRKYFVESMFQLLIRGLLTYYGSWILLFLILYDLFG